MKFSDIQTGSVPPETIQAIRRTGVAVVRGVVLEDVAEGLLTDVHEYLSKHKFSGFPFNIFKGQVRQKMRKHRCSHNADNNDVERI